MKLKIYIDGIYVEGTILRSTGEISVQITQPYQHISDGSHIPCFARGHISFDGERGDKVAKSLLKGLYSIGCYLDSEMSSIRRELDETKDHISQLPLKFNNEQFTEEKRKLKKSFKLGEFDSKAYQQQLKLLKKRLEEYNQTVSEMMDSFFKKSFPMCIPYGTTEQVLDIIERNNLMAGSTD